jgi:hypothetical protein
VTLHQYVFVFLGYGIWQGIASAIRYRHRRHLKGTVLMSSEGDMWVHNGWEFVRTTPEEQAIQHDPKYRLG